MGIKVGLHTPSSETAAAVTVTSDSDSLMFLDSSYM